MAYPQQATHQHASPLPHNAHHLSFTPGFRPIEQQRPRTMSLTILEPIHPGRTTISSEVDQKTPSSSGREAFNTAPCNKAADHNFDEAFWDGKEGISRDGKVENGTDDEANTSEADAQALVPAQDQAKPGWTPALEERLVYLEAQLKASQRRWSASQEFWLEEIEPLLKLRHDHRKSLKSRKPPQGRPGNDRQEKEEEEEQQRKQTAVLRAKRAIGIFKRQPRLLSSNRNDNPSTSLARSFTAPNEASPSFTCSPIIAQSTKDSDSDSGSGSASSSIAYPIEFARPKSAGNDVDGSPILSRTCTSPPAEGLGLFHSVSAAASTIKPASNSLSTTGRARPSSPKLLRTSSSPLVQRLWGFRRPSAVSPSPLASSAVTSVSGEGTGKRRVSAPGVQKTNKSGENGDDEKTEEDQDQDEAMSRATGNRKHGNQN